MSPDARYTLAWSDHGLVVSGASDGVLSPAITEYPAPEILWSSDGDRVAITWSDGGAVGVWQVDAYDLSEGVVRDLNVPEVITPKPESPVIYNSGNRPSNLAAIAWLDDGAGLLVVSEPSFRRSGKGYAKPGGLLLSFSDQRVVGSIEGEALVKTWRHLLGPRVLGDGAD